MADQRQESEEDREAKVPAIRVFCAYSRDDEVLLVDLRNHLALLRRQDKVAVWHDRVISPGAEWEDEIDENLNNAEIVLLLISASFISSDYCFGKEMVQALKRHEEGEAIVIPIILRHVDWHGAPFGKLQALPLDGKPVKSWTDPDEAWTDVAKGVRVVVDRLRAEYAEKGASSNKQEESSSTAVGSDRAQNGDLGSIDELGIFDYACMLEDSMQAISDRIALLHDDISEFGSDAESAVESINEGPSTSGSGSFARKRAAAAKIAHVLNKFADKVESHAPEIDEAWISLRVSGEQLIAKAPLVEEEEIESARELSASLSTFGPQVDGIIEQVREPKKAIRQLKGYSQDINKAVPRCEMALERLAGIFLSGKSVTEGLAVAIENRIEKDSVIPAKLSDNEVSTGDSRDQVAAASTDPSAPSLVLLERGTVSTTVDSVTVQCRVRNEGVRAARDVVVKIRNSHGQPYNGGGYLENMRSEEVKSFKLVFPQNRNTGNGLESNEHLFYIDVGYRDQSSRHFAKFSIRLHKVGDRWKRSIVRL